MNAGLFHWQEKLGKSNPNLLKLVFQITAAKTVSPVPQGTPTLTAFDAIASQAVIDDFLGTSSEFSLAAFDATSLGADAFACVVNMAGQVKDLIYAKAQCYSGTGGATLVERLVGKSAALTDSTLATEAAVGSSGNLALKVDFGNTPDFDALTAGYIVVEFAWIAK